MIVAGVQIGVSRTDPAGNLAKAEHFIHTAVQSGARIACLQEYFATGLFTEQMDPSHWELAEPLDGPTLTRMRRLAQALSVWLIVPLFERDARVPGRYFDTAAVLDVTGRIAGLYRKQFVPLGQSHEKYYFTPGNLGTPVFQAGDLCFGIMICYDRHFFELPRIMTLKGATTVFVPNCSYRAKGRSDVWAAEIASIGANNAAYVVAVNSTGQNDGRDQFGQSMIVDPLGTVLDQLGEEEGVVLADVSAEAVRQARTKNRLIRDLRRDVIEELLAQYTPGWTAPAE